MAWIKDVFEKLSDKNKESIIEYDLSGYFVTIYDEIYGVARRKNQYLKNGKARSYTYLGATLFRLGCVLLLNFLSEAYIFTFGLTWYSMAIMSLTPALYILLAINIVWFIIRINMSKSRLKGTIKLTKEGLIDSTFDGIKILFEWRLIKVIVVKKNSLVILTSTPCYFFVNKEVGDKLIREIKKYKEDIKIIRED